MVPELSHSSFLVGYALAAGLIYRGQIGINNIGPFHLIIASMDCASVRLAPVGPWRFSEKPNTEEKMDSSKPFMKQSADASWAAALTILAAVGIFFTLFNLRADETLTANFGRAVGYGGSYLLVSLAAYGLAKLLADLGKINRPKFIWLIIVSLLALTWALSGSIVSAWIERQHSEIEKIPIAKGSDATAVLNPKGEAPTAVGLSDTTGAAPGPAAPRFIVQDALIRDTKRRLLFTKCVHGQQVVENHCTGNPVPVTKEQMLGFARAARKPFRLPTLNELKELYDGLSDGHEKQWFPAEQFGKHYWTSSPLNDSQIRTVQLNGRLNVSLPNAGGSIGFHDELLPANLYSVEGNGKPVYLRLVLPLDKE